MSTNTDEDVSLERNEKAEENAVNDFREESGFHSLSCRNDQSSSSTTAETDLNLNLSNECKLEDMDENHLQTEIHMSTNSDKDVSRERNEKAEENAVNDFREDSGFHSISCRNDQSSSSTTAETDLNLNLSNECKLEDVDENHLQTEGDNEICKFQNTISLPEADPIKTFSSTLTDSLNANGNSNDSSSSNLQKCPKNTEVTNLKSSQNIMENISSNAVNKTSFEILESYYQNKNLHNYEKIKAYLQNQDINGILSLNISDTYLKSVIDDCILSRSDLNAIENTILPLVTLQAEIQDTSSIDKMIINEQTVSKICNQLFEGRTFYKDPTAGNVINFNELSRKNCKIVTLFGKMQNIFQFLQFQLKLTESELFSCYAKIQKTGSGIYLVNNLLIQTSIERIGFLCLFSKNDSYYDDVTSKSQAIHFLRYMTMLSNNVIVLPNVDDVRCFPILKGASAKTKRHSSYTLQQCQLQKEECSIHEFGEMMLPNSLNDCKIFSSNTQGVLIANIKKTLKQNSYMPISETLSADQFWNKYKNVEFRLPEQIEFSFKEQYLAFCKPEQFCDKKKSLYEIEKELSKNIHFQFEDELLLLLSQKIFDLTFPLEFALLKNCIELSKDDSLTFQHARHNMISSFPHIAKPEILNEMRKLYNHSLKSHLGIEVLKEQNLLIGKSAMLVENNSLQEIKDRNLYTTKSRLRIWPRIYIYDAIVDFSKRAENKPIFDFVVQQLISFLRTFGHDFLLKNEDFKLFIKNSQDKYIKKHRDEQWKITVNKEFREIVSNVSSKVNVIVNSISKCNGSEKDFVIRLQIRKDDEEKCILDFHKLVLKKDSKFDNSSMISKRNHNILQIGTHEIEGEKAVFHVYPCEVNYIMLLMNFNEQSCVNIINAKNGKSIIEMPFGKPISLSSFDNNLRVLAIYSTCTNFNGFSFYKFSTDFKNYHKINQINVEVTYAIGKINCIELQYQSKFLWILDSDSRICRIDYNTRNISIDKKFKPPNGIFHSLKIHPKGYCLFLFAENSKCYPIMLETYTVLPSINLEPTSLICNISGFSAASNLNSSLTKMQIQKFKITTAKSELKIKKESEEDKSEEHSETFHWLYYFYWMFVKFPCNDLLKLNQKQLRYSYLVSDATLIKKDFENCLQNYMSRIKNSLLQTNKPLQFIGLINKVSIKSFKTFSLKEIEETSVGEIIQLLICLVPRQIARCQFSEFYILNDGEQLNISESRDVFELKDKISMGLFEAVFNSWHKEIKVVSSMGKQSTGKSYTLNHLTGSSYDISGSRCTDGCWLTLKVTEDCLYVVLDFEGLGSFERTDQDDMLLSLFNSAISNMTLFKTEYRLDKDVDQMFTRFNLGSSQMKDSEHLFQGRFFIIIKDVAEQDIDDVQHEFEEKITTIITKESEKNFISKLYQCGFDILPFSMFQLEEYYHDMENLCNIMIKYVKGTFHDGTSFLDFLKLLLAKLAINDFTSIGRQQIDGRIKYLKNCMKYAIIYGQISSDVPKKEELDLRNLDDISNKIIREKSVNLSEISMTISFNDFEYIFIDDYLSDIVYKFSTIYPQDNNNNQLWRLGLENFLKNALIFRFERVQMWIQLNTKKFKLENSVEFDDICIGLHDYFCKLKDDLQNTFLFCNEICSKCFLKCTKIVNHYEDHCCSTEHECTALCLFCDDKNFCKYPMGHEGKHHCNKVNHMCGQPCKYFEINNCKNECQLECNHPGDHICCLSSHICSKNCSLPDCTSTCNIHCDFAHEIHKCIKEQCIKKCCIENCTNKCTAMDHFHGSELSYKFKTENNICEQESFTELHFCGNEHKCDQLCSINGYCKVTVEKSVMDVEFIGARDKFTYKRQFVQNGEKVNCLKIIKPFETKHGGDHICSNDTNKVHTCMEVCPTCENICDKPYGHYRFGDHLHDTSHGNMVHCSFIANVEDFNVGSHKYKVGEPAIAEMCHIFCNSLGRGHIHVIKCDKQNEECVYDAQDDLRRHETCQYGPDFNVEKDEIQHTEYWDTIGWKDPCTEADISDFEKCPCFCSSGHESEIFCIGELWHDPYKTLVDSGISKGTITDDGHLFPCEHDSHSFHFVLALDASGSMGGSPWNSLRDSVHAFIKSRQTLSNASDMISVIVYSGTSHIAAEYIELSRFSTDMLKYIGGNTCFSLALHDVDAVIERNLTKLVTPILIFMSDGCAGDGDKEMVEIERKYRDSKFKCYTVGFGLSRFDKLRRLASLGGGFFHECSTDIKLKNAFVEIAAKHPSMVSVVALK